MGTGNLYTCLIADGPRVMEMLAQVLTPHLTFEYRDAREPEKPSRSHVAATEPPTRVVVTAFHAVRPPINACSFHSHPVISAKSLRHFCDSPPIRALELSPCKMRGPSKCRMDLRVTLVLSQPMNRCFICGSGPNPIIRRHKRREPGVD
jgi:hypothetical protein